MHIRTQLRNKAKKIISDALGIRNVFLNRTHVIQARELSAAIIKTNSETLEMSTIGNLSDRDIELVIELYDRSSDDVDDKLDNMCTLVENAFNADETLNVDLMELLSTDIDIADGDQQIGVATMSYQVKILNTSDPEQVI